MLRLLAVALMVTVSSTVASAAAEEETKQPNVILILVDDLGVADVSYSSRRLHKDKNGFVPAIETPNLDYLAEDAQGGGGGVQLTNAFTHAVCGPSRAAIVTGRLAHNLGNPFPMLEGGSLDPKYKTVGHEFKLRGYSTHFIGKWGIDYPRPSDEVLEGSSPKPSYEVFNGHQKGMGPVERGFDTFYGLYSSGHNHYTKEIMFKGAVDWHRHNSTHKLDYPDVDHEPTEYSTHLFTREAVEVVKSWSSKSSTPGGGFLHLSYTAPHDPLQAPQEYMERPSCRKMKNWRRRTYCGMVTAIDDGVGTIRQALEQAGLADNTVILFSTDNGGAPSVGGYNYPYRGQKATIYQGGLRTPAFLHVPPGVLAGSKIRDNLYSNVVHIADFAPTLLGIVDRASGHLDRLGRYEALGMDIDGVDRSELIFSGGNFDVTTSSETTTPPRKSAVLEYNAVFDHAAYLEGEWKLLLGAAGRADRFEEPTGRYYDSLERPRFVVEERVCDAIDGLGANWFLYGWAMRFMVDIAFDALQPSGSGKAAKARTNRMKALIRNSPYGATIEITEDRLPQADFANYDPSEIQLYNLKDDPYEDQNVAYENQDRVLEMLGRLKEEVKGDPGHHFSLQKFFAENMINIITAVVAVTLCSVAAFAGLLYYHCVWKKPKKEKTS